jgi:hypothetical protein
MNQPEHTILRAALAGGAMLLALYAQAQVSSDKNVPAAVARQQAAEIARGDPPRWQQEDSTMAARLQTIRKETAAGLQENLGACRALAAPERAACVKEARAIYQQEMASARARAASEQ